MMPTRLSPPLPRSLSRRDLLLNAGAGFAGLALTHLLDRDGLLHARPLSESKVTAGAVPSGIKRQTTSFSCSRQIGHFSVHVRRSQPCRSL